MDKQPMSTNENMQMQLIVNRLEQVHDEVGTLRKDIHTDLKGVMSEMSNAVNKLVALEERGAYMNRNYERLESQLEKTNSNFQLLEGRIDTLEKDAPDNKRISNWIYSGIAAIAGLALTAAGKFFGLI